MKEKEKLLFKELCKFKKVDFDETLLEYATPHVLGLLFFNRMQGVAFNRMTKHEVLGKINREFKNSLKSAYEQNVQRNRSFEYCVSMVSEILRLTDCKVAMLKGAFLCTHYPKGCRTSNDIDLLVTPEDVTKIGNLLTNSGFKQGNLRNGIFIPATRREIIESKMMRGETVPYIKEVNLPGLRYLEVDINFSLDYKNGDKALLSEILDKIVVVNENGVLIPTLCKEDFFIHLCAHLYKEATTLPWIEMHRDMTLYKYCDIYMLLSEMDDTDIKKVFDRAKELDAAKVCAYSILETAGLFDIDFKAAINLSKEALKNNDKFMLKVASPKDKKELIYQTSDVTERFFMENRSEDLKEVE